MGNAYGMGAYGKGEWGGTGSAVFGYPADAPTNIIVKAIPRPWKAPLRKLSPHDITDGGVHYSYSKGINERLFHVNLKLTEAEKDTLDGWIDDNADGDYLWFIDPYGGSHKVRVVGSFDLEEVAQNTWKGSLTLRKED